MPIALRRLREPFLLAFLALAGFDRGVVAQEPRDEPTWACGIGAQGSMTMAGGRRAGRASLGRGGRLIRYSLERGLQWLAAQQHEDGYWLDPRGEHPDVERTALALFCFLGEGSLPWIGEFSEQVDRSLRWLRSEQDPETGFVGKRSRKRAHRGHAVATLAIVEATVLIANEGREQRLPHLANPEAEWIQLAVDRLRFLRESGDSWPPQARNGLPAEAVHGFSDLALLRHGHLAEFLELRRKDPTARLPTRRNAELLDDEPWQLVRIFDHGFRDDEPRHDPFDRPIQAMLEGAEQRWTDGRSLHPARRVLQTYPMFQFGGRGWQAWEKAEIAPLTNSPEGFGGDIGSWSPAKPDCDRLMTTALNLITLQVYYRYSRVLR